MASALDVKVPRTPQTSIQSQHYLAVVRQEGLRSILGEQAVLTGFYSYGEIAPFSLGECSELHNQTMSITTFAEI